MKNRFPVQIECHDSGRQNRVIPANEGYKMSKEVAMEKFRNVIDEMIQFFDEMIGLYERKQESLNSNRLMKLEELLNEEQALALKMKGLEKKRERVLVQMGKENLTFREIIQEMEGDSREEMRNMYERLSSKVASFQALKESVASQLEINQMDLHIKLMKEQKKKDEQRKSLMRHETASKAFTSIKV